MKIKMTKKYYIIIGILALVAGGFFLLRDGEEEKEFTTTERGNLVKEVFETGSTEKGEEINLSFKEGGRVENIYTKEGEKVSRGEVVAELDKSDLRISLREARANLEAAEADYQKLLDGATAEDISVIQSAVNSAESELVSAEESLQNQKKVTNEMLREAYQNTNTFLGDVFMSVDEIKDDVVDIANEYFASFVVPETTSGRRSRDAIRRSVGEVENYRDMVQKEASFSEKREALEETEYHLKNILKELDNLIDVAESDFYKDRFLEEHKKLLKTHRSTTNTYITETSSFIGKISSVEAEVSSVLTSARAKVASAESALKGAQAELSKVEAEAGETDLRKARAGTEQAKARVELAQSKLNDASLKSPVPGTVSSAHIRRGEIASPGTPVFTITPDEEIQVAVDIYEGDIGEVEVGDPVIASFVAFPGEDFKGEVVFVNEAGRVIDGVVYYETKIMLDEYPENTLPQMTVDVTIKTEEKKDVLFVPDRAVQRKEGKAFVSVMEEGELREREVETGITGERREVEIISGLKEEEKVLTR